MAFLGPRIRMKGCVLNIVLSEPITSSSCAPLEPELILHRIVSMVTRSNDQAETDPPFVHCD